MNYPQAPDAKIQTLSNILVRYAESEGVDFSFGEQQVYPLEAFAHFGGLSLFLIEAKETYEKVYNKNLYTIEELMQDLSKSKIQLTPEQILQEQEYLEKQVIKKVFPIDFYEQEEDTYFGFIPRISENIPSDFSILSCFAHYTLEEYIKIYKKNKMLLIEGKIPLDPLYDKMVKKINANQIQVKATQKAKLVNENTETQS